MIEGDSPRKNLWKNLQTQKAKYSLVQQIINSPVISNSKQSNHNSEPVRLLQLEKSYKSSQNRNNLESNFGNVEKQINFNLQEEAPNFMEQGKNFLQKLGSIEQSSELQKSYQNKSRRLSIGQQQVVQQVVDFKYQNILEIGEDQDQQPMIMSLGSQSNPAIRMLKLSRIKDDIYKLQNAKNDIMSFIIQQKARYKQFFKVKFHEALNYIQFCAQKIDLPSDQNFDKQQNQTRVTNLKKAKSYVTESTPRFPKHINSLASSKINKMASQQIYVDQNAQERIEHLQEQIFKQKTNNQRLNETIQLLKKQNDEMNEQIFDYQQKLAQFQLEVNERVEQLLTKKMKQSFKMRNHQQLQNQRREYLDQILSLQRQIQKLEQKSYNKQYIKMKEELVRREEYLIEKQKDIFDKERNLNELEVQLNSEKLDLQRKLKNVQIKETQIRSAHSKLDQMQIQLAMKEREINNKELEKLRDENIRVGSQSGFHRDANRDYDYHHEFKAKSFAYKIAPTAQPSIHEKQWSHNRSNTGPQNIQTWRHRLQIQSSHNKQPYSISKKKKESRQKSSKQKGHLERSYMVSRMTPTNNLQSQNNSFSHFNSLKGADKNRLEDLGTKLQNLRNQIRKEIRDSE